MRRHASRGQTRGVTFGRVRAAASRLTWSTAERKRARHCSPIFNRGSAVAPIASRESRDKWLSQAAAAPLGLELLNFATSRAAWSAYRPGDAMSHSDRLRDWRLPRWAPIGFPAGVLPGAGGRGRLRTTGRFSRRLSRQQRWSVSGTSDSSSKHQDCLSSEAARRGRLARVIAQCCRQSRPQSPSCRRSLFPRSH